MQRWFVSGFRQHSAVSQSLMKLGLLCFLWFSPSLPLSPNSLHFSLIPFHWDCWILENLNYGTTFVEKDTKYWTALFLITCDDWVAWQMSYKIKWYSWMAMARFILSLSEKRYVFLSTPGPTLLRQPWTGNKQIVPDLTRWWSAGKVLSLLSMKFGNVSWTLNGIQTEAQSFQL